MKRILICGALLGLTACDQSRPSQDAPSGASPTPVQVAVVETKAPAAVPVTPEGDVAASAVAGRTTQQRNLLTTAVSPEKPRQRPVIHTPAVGSPERVELMNALRDKVRGDLGGEPIFVVRELRSNGDWAFARVEPTWRDGRAIDASRTPLYRRYSDPNALDGLHVEAIWKKERGRWQVYVHNIAATDVWWLDFCDRVPRAVLGAGC